ncbi:MAG: leucine-rich repeat domain-containing protein, partial [Lachnospiraceae bacterium]|nr:leucine-rich repeat domain-containing protein [Lachnospiraceae bacterium]
MALKSGKKKMSRKLKRTIRKTLSGICLASALVVALIPAAPARAKVDPVYNTTTVSYDYGVQDADETDLKVLDTNLTGIELDVNNITPAPQIWETKTVTKLSDGSYEIMWQFKVYTIGGRGIICEYNSLYNKGELEIKASLPLDYMVVETDFYDAFYQAHADAATNSNNYATIQRNPGSATPTVNVLSNYHLSSIEDMPSLGSVQDVVATYWPTDFQNYKTGYEAWKARDDAYNAYVAEQTAWQAKSDAWNAYVTAHEAWATGADPDPATEPQPGPGVTPPGQPPTPVAPAGSAPEQDFWVADMTIGNKQKFFLEGQPYYNEELGGVAMARTYTLTSVIDSRNGAQTPQQFIWMPQGEPNAAANHNRVNDSLGFVGSSWTAILGIGDRAFANTSNVTNLKLAGELKYIGDEAFANSFVESINFANVEDIGNRAYKNCTKLKNITLSDATVNIGTEAFYGCNSLTSLALPQSISYIGPGAFADCTALSSLDLSAINQSNCDIDDFAFYDCIALSNVVFSDKINRIGNAAFAVNKGVTGTLTSFTFPDHITGSHSCKIHTASGGVNGIGNFVLAGRTNLRTINMPADYGRTSNVTLPCGVFYNCINLQSVTFPNDGGGSCGNVSFEKVGTGADQRTVFDTIQTQEFRVYGPATNSAGQIAAPRKSTWGLKSGLGNDIPYIYTDSTGEHVELSQGDYIFIIDDKGVLLSCVYADPQNVPASIDTMTIPTYVGDTKVTGISSSCFATQEAQELLDRVKNLVFKDDTISEIAANAFSGCDLLETVTIGNSVQKIGDSAFANCPNLVKVNIGSGVTEIGNGAFKNCNRLTYVKFDSPKGGYSSFPLEGIGAEAF